MDIKSILNKFDLKSFGQKIKSIKLTKKHILIFSIPFFAILAVISGILIYGNSLVNAEGMVQGLYIGDFEVSGKTAEQINTEIVPMLTPGKETYILFSCSGTPFGITADEAGLTVNAQKAIEEASSYAKSGTFFQKIYQAYDAKFNTKTFMPEYLCNNELLTASLQAHLSDRITPPKPYSANMADGKITIVNPVNGTGIKTEGIADKVAADMADGKIENTIDIELVPIPAEPIDIENLYASFAHPAKDATYSLVNGVYSFTDEADGLEIDKEAAKQIIEANKENTQPYDIPCTIIKPKVTVKELQKKYAAELLATYSTSFASSDANRAANVVLATQKINGVVLQPGQRFSYNNIVGPRTEATGFKMAHVYVGEDVVDGIGGGICQVSSTLYNAVLLSDLKVVYRTNHSMPVGYVPDGRDATVNYGTIDFIFENNKKYPVKIVATADNRLLKISIYGVKEDDTTVEIATELVSTIPYSTKETLDPNLKPGEKKVTKQGSNGSVVNTYKIYKKNGQVIEKKHISKSTYTAVTKHVSVGPAAEETP